MADNKRQRISDRLKNEIAFHCNGCDEYLCGNEQEESFREKVVDSVMREIESWEDK